MTSTQQGSPHRSHDWKANNSVNNSDGETGNGQRTIHRSMREEYPLRELSTTGSVLIIAERAKGARLNSILDGAGYLTSLSSGREDAITRLQDKPEALVLVMLENESSPLKELGDWLRQLRKICNVPAMAVLPQDMLNSQGFPWGLNDFILEPFHSEELVLRVHRLLGPPGRGGRGLIIYGDLVIDSEEYKVSVGGRPVYLTFKEFELLRFLASQPGKVFNREVLLNEVWGYDFFGGGRTVDVHIRHLRSKIEDKNHSFISTVRRIGYRFEA